MISHRLINGTARPIDVIDLANFAEVGTFMKHVFSNAEDEQLPAESSEKDRSEDDQAAAFETDEVDLLLTKASKAIEFLAARCAIMEKELSDKEELAVEHEVTARQWQQFAVKLQAQTSSDQDTIADLLARSDAAEARIVLLEAAAAQAGERSAAAHAQSTKLQGQVVAAFGRKSPVHSVLQSITLQEAAE